MKFLTLLYALIILSLLFIGYACFKISDLDESRKTLSAEIAPEEQSIDRIMNVQWDAQIPIDHAKIPPIISSRLQQLGVKSVVASFTNQFNGLTDYAAIYTKSERHGELSYQVITHIDYVGNMKESNGFYFESGQVYGMPKRSHENSRSVIIYRPNEVFTDQHGYPIYENKVISVVDLIFKNSQGWIKKNKMNK